MNTSENVKQIMDLFNLSLDEVAKYLGITTQSLRNKLNRDSFSIKDLVIISHMCDGELNIRFIIHDEIEPIKFGHDILAQNDVQRLKGLDQEKARKSIEGLATWLPKLSPKEQKEIIDSFKFVKDLIEKEKP